MKRLASIILFIGVFLGISAQENTFRFGYLSYEGAIQSMPDYAIVQKKMKTLQEQFQAETLRVEDEFNRKYEDFLDGQRDFPRTILDAEREAMAPLRIRLIELLSTIGREKGFAFIYDTDTKALPFLNIDFGEDINQLVQDALK